MRPYERICNYLSEMGRPRKEMGNFLISIRDTVEEHIWKIYAYHKSRPLDVNGWVKSLNKHYVLLKRKNIAEKGSGYNFNRDKIRKLWTETMFETIKDISTLANVWADEGFPEVEVDGSDLIKLRNMCDKYIDLIFADRGKFSVSEEELKN